VHDRALGLFCGLNVLPKRTHLTGYSYRPTRAHNLALLEALVPRQRELGLISGESFNLDFHAIMSYGEDQILEEHYVPRRSQRTRAVLTFFAQDGASQTLVYANADLTKANQADEVLVFAEHWRSLTGRYPARLVMDQKVTTQAVLGELDRLGVTFVTLRMRSVSLLDHIASIPAGAWRTVALDRDGAYRRPKVVDEETTLSSYPGTVRQLVVTGLGRERFGVLALIWSVLSYFSFFDLGVGRAPPQRLPALLLDLLDGFVGSLFCL